MTQNCAVFVLTPGLGIDVQAELQAKTGSPSLLPARAASANASPSMPPLQQRAILNRQQQRRSVGGPLKDGTHNLPMLQPDGPINRSPLSQPTPGSHLSSPAHSTTRSPNFVAQGTSVSPNFGPLPQQHHPPLRPRTHFASSLGPGPQRPSIITNHAAANTNGSSGASSAVTQSTASGGGSSSFFPSPFESHMTQLGKLSRFLSPPLRHRALFVLY